MTAYSSMAIQLRQWYDWAEGSQEMASFQSDAAFTDWMNNEDHLAIGHLVTACTNLASSLFYIISRYTESSPYFRLCRLHQLSWEYTMAEPPEFELTVEAICETWAKDNFKGRALTIGFIDRMRQLIWDEPFYVAWASRPEEQGT